MKSLSIQPTTVLLAAILIFLSTQKCFSQDSLSFQDFEKGVPASSFTATPGDQSATLSWASASYPSSGASQAGYLLIFSTSVPSLVSFPNGLSPEFAVFNGTIVTTTVASLPNKPATFATANGLTDGTTYNFFLVAFFWDGINASTYQYSSPATICVTIPPDEPEGLSLSSAGATVNSISGSFTAPLFNPDGYLVIYSTSIVVPAIANGHVYKEGEAFGMDTVAQASSSVDFNTINSGHQLTPSTTYYIYVFSYSLSGCNNMPIYSAGYIADSISTLAAVAPVFMMLDYFTASKASSYNKLTWKAACSSSSFNFEAQSSPDSINFTDIYTVRMNDASACAQPFGYDDYANMDAKKIFYRIKMIDTIGQLAYSNIEAIVNEGNKSEAIHLAQNPVMGDALLQVSSSQNDELILMIYSIDGRELLRKTVQVQKGSGIITLRTDALAKGMYVIRGMFSSGLNNIMPFIKQ